MIFVRRIIVVLFCLSLALPTFAVTKDQQISFLSLADIHFDPFINCKQVKPCPLIEALRHVPAAQWASVLTEYHNVPPQYWQDTNIGLLDSAFSAAKQAAKAEHVQFVVVLGDFIGHDSRRKYRQYTGDKTAAGYQSFIRKTLEFLSLELARTFPATDIYISVGNNDSYQNDYVTNLDGAFFRDGAMIWSSSIKDRANRMVMQKEFSDAGYYAVDIPQQTQLRLIVLNTNVFSLKARGHHIDKAANDELNWLHEQLSAAKDKRQRVLIAMHIPMTFDINSPLHTHLFSFVEFWKPAYSQRFEVELSQFAPQIAGVLTGHIHSDWFQMLVLDRANEIPLTGTASISPIFGNNPGFKIYTYSPISGQLEHSISYSHPLHSSTTWDVWRQSDEQDLSF